eukprot:2944802-Amphidinium_carterae.1
MALFGQGQEDPDKADSEQQDAKRLDRRAGGWGKNILQGYVGTSITMKGYRRMSRQNGSGSVEDTWGARGVVGDPAIANSCPVDLAHQAEKEQALLSAQVGPIPKRASLHCHWQFGTVAPSELHIISNGAVTLKALMNLNTELEKSRL